MKIDRSHAPAPGSRLENEVLERRLAQQDSTVGKPSLTRVTDRFKEYLALASTASSSSDGGKSGSGTSNSSVDDKEKRSKLLLLHQEVTRETELYELECSKMQRQHAASLQETAHYKSLGDGFEAQIAATERDLGDLARQLEENKVVRRHRKLIDEYAAEVRLLPSRKILKTKHIDSKRYR